jgi:hypothetical protein
MSMRGGGSGKPDGRMSYGCRRVYGGVRCTRPMTVSRHHADALVERIMVSVLADSAGFDIVATARELSAAETAWKQRKHEREQFVGTAAFMDPEDYATAYAAHRDREAAAHDHYRTLLAKAEEADEFPTSMGAWELLDESRQRVVARSVVGRINVLPALGFGKGAPVEHRLQVVLADGREVNGADI